MELIDAPQGTPADFVQELGRFARTHRADGWSGMFADFLDQVLPQDAALLARSSHQYVWDMLRAHSSTGDDGGVHCSLFADELYGIDEALGRVIDYFRAAAAGSEVGRRLLLLLGPPSSGKSSLVILLKRGLEEYSHTGAGALYAIHGCPVHESPLHLVPHSLRAQCRAVYGIDVDGELCPYCRARLESEFGGDFLRMPVARFYLSEAGRSGIGTYAPHDPTTADLADLVGSVDLSKVAELGDEGDPRAWSWSGAVYAASRGVLEMIEILKVKREFLYLLLTLTQERNVKVARFPLIHLDETILAHTNLAEFRKFLRELLLAVRAEACYFAPIHACHIMNEGWAAYWHARLLREADFLPAGLYVEALQAHSDVVRPYAAGEQLALLVNPYHLGFSIWEQIVAQHGLERALQVRAEEDDAGFIRNHLDDGLAAQLDLLVYESRREGPVRIASRELPAIHEAILGPRYRFGAPAVSIHRLHPDHTLELRHDHRLDGRGLDLPRAEQVLQYLARLWGREVRLYTVDFRGVERLLAVHRAAAP